MINLAFRSIKREGCFVRIISNISFDIFSVTIYNFKQKKIAY